MSASKYTQSFGAGERAILNGPLSGDPAIVTICGHERKDGDVFFYGNSNNWARPEDFVKVSKRTLGLLDDAFEGLQEYHPSELTEKNRASIYLAVLGKYSDKENGAQGDYELIRDLIEVEAAKIALNEDEVLMPKI